MPSLQIVSGAVTVQTGKQKSSNDEERHRCGCMHLRLRSARCLSGSVSASLGTGKCGLRVGPAAGRAGVGLAAYSCGRGGVAGHNGNEL